MHTTHFVANGNIQTAFSESGDGWPFVLVHGFTGSKLDFHDQLARFEDLRRVIAYDQRGHGESSNQGPYSIGGLVADLIGFLDQIGIQKCDLLGHSLGGMVAMRAVLEYPDRFSSLILMDTAAQPVKITPANVFAQLNTLVMEEGCTALMKMMRGLPASRAAQRGVDYLGEAEHWRRINLKLAQMDPQAFVELGNELGSYAPVADQLSDIAVPTTVVVGEKDLPFVGHARELAAIIPGARLASIPFAAHSPQYENADAWCDSVRAHLTR